MGQPVIHDFHERLAHSLKASDEPFWNLAYRKAFFGVVGFIPIAQDCEAQRNGIDRLVAFEDGRVLRFDEKKRDEVWPDILLEYRSNDRTQTPGWMDKALKIDFLAYAFMPTRRVYFFPWGLLRRSWTDNRDTWIANAKADRDGFRHITARNRTYSTLSIAVPIPALMAALQQAATRMVIIVDVETHA